MAVKRPYVIENVTLKDGSHTYGAYWLDDKGWTPMNDRLIIVFDTVEDVKGVMERHYPGSECVYTPLRNKHILKEVFAVLRERESASVDA